MDDYRTKLLLALRKGGKAKGKRKKDSGIHINPKNEGTFTKSAQRAGMGVQEYAAHVLAHKEDYDALTIRRANFARNATKWKHEDGGAVMLQGGGYTVKSGDSLSTIASRNGMTLDELLALNPQIGNPNLIQVGQTINLHATGQDDVNPKKTKQPNQDKTPGNKPGPFLREYTPEHTSGYNTSQAYIIKNGQKKLTPECSEWANWVQNSYLGNSVYGNAWTRNSNDNTYKICSGYDTLEKPGEYSLSSVKKYVLDAADNLASNLDISKVRDGDIVGLYYKPSDQWHNAYNEGTNGAAHTHTGNIRVVDGVPYVEHNIHGKIHTDKLEDILGSNHTYGVTEIYRQTHNRPNFLGSLFGVRGNAYGGSL